MDDDYGSDLANYQAEQEWYEQKDMCSECETKYDKNGYCLCKEG